MIATKTCACGQEIEFEAEQARECVCPNCGVAVVAEGEVLPVRTRRAQEFRTLREKIKAKRETSFFALVLMLAAACVAIYALHLSLSSSDKAPPQTKLGNGEVYNMVTNAVMARLKAPRSAVWDGPGAMRITGNGHGDFLVSGYVDSQNAFGALIRTKFTVEIRNNVLGDVEFEGDEKPKTVPVVPARSNSPWE